MGKNTSNPNLPHLVAPVSDLDMNIGKVGYSYKSRRITGKYGKDEWVSTTEKLWWRIYMTQKDYNGRTVYRVHQVDESGATIQTAANMFGSPRASENITIVGNNPSDFKVN